MNLQTTIFLFIPDLRTYKRERQYHHFREPLDFRHQCLFLYLYFVYKNRTSACERSPKFPIPATQILARPVKHASVLSFARLKPGDFEKNTSIQNFTHRISVFLDVILLTMVISNLKSLLYIEFSLYLQYTKTQLSTDSKKKYNMHSLIKFPSSLLVVKVLFVQSI